MVYELLRLFYKTHRKTNFETFTHTLNHAAHQPVRVNGNLLWNQAVLQRGKFETTTQKSKAKDTQTTAPEGPSSISQHDIRKKLWALSRKGIF